MDRKWPYSRASAQVRLVADMSAAAGITIGVHLNGRAGRGVTHYSLAGGRMATVTEELAAIDGRIGAGAATPNHVLSVSPVQDR